MVGVAKATVLILHRLSFLLKIAYTCIPFKKQELNIHDKKTKELIDAFPLAYKNKQKD